MMGFYIALLLWGGLVASGKGLLAASSATDLPWWVFYPQGWFILVTLAIAWLFYRQRPSVHAWIFAAAYPVAVALVSFWAAFGEQAPAGSWENAVSNWHLEWVLNDMGLVSLVLLYAGLFLFAVLKPVHKSDITACTLAFIAAFGEGYMWVERYLCNVAFPTSAVDIISAKIEGTDPLYACSRLDWDFLVLSPVAAQAAVIALLVWYYQRAKRMR